MNGSTDRAMLDACRINTRPASAGTAMATPRIDAATVLQIQAAVLAQAGFCAAATAFANELATHFGATRVYLGRVEHESASIAAISGEVDFLRNSEICRAAAAAMDEAIEQSASIVYPTAPGSPPRVMLAHAAVSRRGAARVVTVPLISAGQITGAVLLEFGAGAAGCAGVIGCCEHLACLVAPVLELKHDADQPWYTPLRLALRALRDRALGPGHAVFKGVGLAGVAVLAALFFWPVAYRVSAPAHLEGAIQRVLVAPDDGFLRAVLVKAGDVVRADQVLVELADQDLELDLRKWTSEFAQHENSYHTALAKNERTQYVVSLGKANSARAQLELVQQAIGRSRIRAPFDGIVIQGDLSQMHGAPVRRGDVLLTVAPANAFRLIVEVDERDIGDVVLGRTGALALAALPSAQLAFKVVRVTPVATARDGRNYYEVEGQIDAPAPALRPGLQGVAKIAAGQRSTAWIWTHRFANWVRLALWTLGG